jgi:hypothetical protein
MSKWYSVRGVRHYDVMIEMEDGSSADAASKDVMDEFNLEEVTEVREVPDDDVERYLRHATDTMEL